MAMATLLILERRMKERVWVHTREYCMPLILKLSKYINTYISLFYSIHYLMGIHFVSTGEFPSHQNIHVLHSSPNAPDLYMMQNL